MKDEAQAILTSLTTEFPDAKATVTVIGHPAITGIRAMRLQSASLQDVGRLDPDLNKVWVSADYTSWFSCGQTVDIDGTDCIVMAKGVDPASALLRLEYSVKKTVGFTNAI